MNNMRRITFGLILCFGSLALAGEPSGDFVKGRGTAISTVAEKAVFNIEIRKVTKDGQSRVTGKVLFSSKANGGLKLEGRVDSLAVSGTEAVAAGRGLLVTKRNGRPARLDGKLTLGVVDLHDPKNPSEAKDGLRLRFVPKNGTDVFEWAGQVDRGDLRIFSRP